MYNCTNASSRGWVKNLADPLVKYLNDNPNMTLDTAEEEGRLNLMSALEVFLANLSEAVIDTPIVYRKTWAEMHSESVEKWQTQKVVDPAIFLTSVIAGKITADIEGLNDLDMMHKVETVAQAFTDISTDTKYWDPQIRKYLDSKKPTVKLFFYMMTDSRDIEMCQKIVDASRHHEKVENFEAIVAKKHFLRSYCAAVAKTNHSGRSSMDSNAGSDISELDLDSLIMTQEQKTVYSKMLNDKLDDSAWKLQKRTSTGNIYTSREFEGQHNAIKMTTRIKANLVQAAEYTRLIFFHPHFIPCVSNKRMTRISEDTHRVDVWSDLMWPATSPRHWSWTTTKAIDRENGAVLHIVRQVEKYKPDKGYHKKLIFLSGIRVRENREDSAYLDIEVVFHTDPKSKIPAWFINKLHMNVAVHHLKGLASMNEPDWQNTVEKRKEELKL